MKPKDKLSWVLNLKSGRNYIPSNFQIFAPIPPKSTFSLSNQNQNSFTIDSSTKSITKPFIVQDRSLLNKNRMPLNETKEHKEKVKFLSFHERNEIRRKKSVDFVKNHSLGFNGEMSDDFFKHYYRMLMVNLIYFLRKHKKYSPKHLEIMENMNNKINFVPADMKLFFLEKTKKDVEFYEKIIEIYEKKNNISEKKKNDDIDKNETFQLAYKNIVLPEKYNAVMDIHEKLFKEDEFLKIFVKKVQKNGVEIISFEDYQLLKEIIYQRKVEISRISIKSSKTIEKASEEPKIVQNPNFSKKGSNFLLIIKKLIEKTGVLENENHEFSLKSMKIFDGQEDQQKITENNKNLISHGKRAVSNSPKFGTNISDYNRFYRSLTQNRKNLNKLGEKDPEFSIQAKIYEKENIERIRSFSKGTQKFLKDILDKRESKLDKILNKIRAKSDGIYIKKANQPSKIKKLKRKSTGVDEDLDSIEEEGLELIKVESLVKEIEKISKMTNEEIMAGDIDDFIARAEALERKIKENVEDVQNNYVTKDQEQSRGDSRAGSNASSTTNRNKKQTTGSDKKHAKNHYRDNDRSVSREVSSSFYKKGNINQNESIYRGEGIMGEGKGKNHYNNNQRKAKGSMMVELHASKRDSSIVRLTTGLNRKTSLNIVNKKSNYFNNHGDDTNEGQFHKVDDFNTDTKNDSHFNIELDRNSVPKDLTNDSHRNLLDVFHHSNNEINKINNNFSLNQIDHIEKSADEFGYIRTNKQINSIDELPLPTLKAIPRKTSSLPNIPNISSHQMNEYQESKPFIRDKSRTVYSKTIIKPFSNNFSNKSPDIYPDAPKQFMPPPKKPPIPSFRNALVLLPHLKKNIKKKIYEHKIIIDKTKIPSSIPSPISPARSGRKSPKTIKKEKVKLIVNRINDPENVNQAIIINEPEKKFETEDENRKKSLNPMTQSSRFLMSKQNSKFFGNSRPPSSKNLLNLKEARTPSKYDLDSELREAILELETMNMLRDTSPKPPKRKKKTKLNREQTLLINNEDQNMLLSQVSQKNDTNASNKDLLNNEMRLRSQHTTNADVDYNEEVRKQKKDEIEMFIRSIAENMEKNVLGEMPCIDKLRAFMEQTENKLKSTNYPWRKKVYIYINF